MYMLRDIAVRNLCS